MSMSYVVDKNQKLVLSTARGILSYRDAYDCLVRLEQDPDFSPAYSHLCDYSKVFAFALSEYEMQLLAARRVFSTSSRWAFVASNQLAFGLARAFESSLEGAGIRQAKVLNTKEEALRWLNSDNVPAAQARKSD